jgi:UDP-N-acetylmuramate-alanine ligase
LQDRYQHLDRLYFLPIGGTAMAPLAGLLREMGHSVQGVDSSLYPPMSTLLEELAIEVRLGFDPQRLPTDIDRVIIGNAVPRDNPGVEAVLERGIAILSQAEAVARLSRGSTTVVVRLPLAGEHNVHNASLAVAAAVDAGVELADAAAAVGDFPGVARRMDERLDRRALADALERRGVRSVMPDSGEDPVARLLPELARGDVVLGCSSGSFDDFHRRLLYELRKRR